ncbi:FecR domain-containing protein [Haloferula sp.]|uniref:FecR domain-containing protein n=1 Tax=Haloferula sp. TaxID=2497595 RepID=UPI003C765720
MTDPELQSLMLRMLDGELSADELAALEVELLGNIESRKVWQKLTRLHSALEVRYESQANVASMPVVPVERVLARQRQRLIKVSLFAAAALIVVSAVSLLLTQVAPRPVLASLRVTSNSAFTLTHAEEGETPLGSELMAGSRLQLTRGTMVGTFASGVRFVAEAPCDLSVLAEDRVSVEEGSTWFEVPAPAVGFTVQTREFEVVDLGTEFGVRALAEEQHEVHVIEGAVEVSSRHVGSGKQTLLAGQARRVDSHGVFHEIVIESGHFTTALPTNIAITNHSFEDDENTDPSGALAKGTRGDFGGELTDWISQSGAAWRVQVGWRDLVAAEVDPYPPVSGRESQALCLISRASVLNVTDTPWSSLHVGDKLTLTVSLGVRQGRPTLDWNEGTFFGLTDDDFSPADVPTVADAVAHSGLIRNNPATGNQSGDGRFADVSFSYTIQAADLARPGSIGVLLSSEGSAAGSPNRNQAFFDNVRLELARAPKSPAQ